MNRISILIITTLLVLGTIVGCSILKGNDTEGKVKNFLTRFSADLQQSDSLVVAHFRTEQPEWALRNALQLMRNSEKKAVTVSVLFQQSIITINDSILVTVPVTLQADSAGINLQRHTNLELTLQQQDTTFVITRWNSENFFEEFWSYNNAIQAGQNSTKIRESRGHFYLRARELEETYDSVIWFANTDPMHYYYVVSGAWEYPYGESLKTDRYRMGLIDESGKQIIPMEFDLIGMPGELAEDLIEVKNGNKFGCYRLSTAQEVIPAKYDWIISYENLLLVKSDTLNGWIDTAQTFHPGFPNQEAKAYITGFKFLPESIRLSNENAEYLEIPSEQYAAVGYFIPSSYLSHFGIFREIEGDYVSEIFNEEAGVEYKETELSFLENIANTFSALITNARDSYVYSREGFYDHSSVTFINDKGRILGTTDLETRGDLTFKLIDSTLLEIKITFPTDVMPEYGGVPGTEFNTPRYAYLSINEDWDLTRLESKRWHLCTKFVKLDSTYITGDFVYTPPVETGYDESRLSHITLSAMRNEILAEYGYIFQDPDVIQDFQYRDWYKPQYATVASFEADLSDIDRHNLEFLEKILGPVDNSTTAM